LPVLALRTNQRAQHKGDEQAYEGVDEVMKLKRFDELHPPPPLRPIPRTLRLI
jgi:hypothetical protein